MDNIFSYIRPLLSISFPFIVLHYFSVYFYKLTLWDVTKWWAFNFTKVDNTGAYLLGFFFAFLILSMSFSGFMNTFYLSLVGKSQELVYLGHHKESHGMYYKIHDISKTPISGYDVDQKYNFSFASLFKPQMFKADPLMPGEVGTKANRFKLTGFISVILSLTVFLLIFLPFFNSITHPVYLANPTDVGLTTKGSMPAFEEIIAHYNISKGWYFALIPILLFSWMGFVVAMSKTSSADPLLPLPGYINTGSHIEGLPIEMNIRYVERKTSTHNGSNSYTTVDSGDRYVIFEFSRGFTQTVYVTAVVNIHSHKSQLTAIEENIARRQAMQVYIDDDLTISLTPDEKPATAK